MYIIDHKGLGDFPCEQWINVQKQTMSVLCTQCTLLCTFVYTETEKLKVFFRKLRLEEGKIRVHPLFFW